MKKKGMKGTSNTQRSFLLLHLMLSLHSGKNKTRMQHKKMTSSVSFLTMPKFVTVVVLK
jgi:hypothetical protein